MVTKRTSWPLVLRSQVQGVGIRPCAPTSTRADLTGGLRTRTSAVSRWGSFAFTGRLGQLCLRHQAVLGSRLMAQHQPPRVHRGTVYGAKHQKGMTLPAISSPVRNPTPEQRTARVERHTTPDTQHTSTRAVRCSGVGLRTGDAMAGRVMPS